MGHLAEGLTLCLTGAGKIVSAPNRKALNPRSVGRDNGFQLQFYLRSDVRFKGLQATLKTLSLETLHR